ncbi:MAG TPA: LmeA family phospholipid-binding protein [Trebonia sp.]|nr:LmeA family phospholipid-binding protein [Trebonia sp.]
MTTDSTQPKRPPASPPDEPQADAQAAPPTVQVPVIKAPDAAAPSTAAPTQAAPQAGQEGVTQAVPRWQAPPPPPPPPPGPQRAPQEQRRQDAPPARMQPPPAAAGQAPPTQQVRPQQPTSIDPPQPTRWERPPEPTWVDPVPPRAQPQDRPQQQGAPQSWNQPQGQPQGWPDTRQLPPQQPRQQPPQSQPPGPPEPQQWEQPQSAWTGVQPWIEPQDDVPGQKPQNQQNQQNQGPWGPPPPQPPANQPRFRRRQRKRRVRRSFMALFTVIVLLILLVIGDRVALAVTENEMASQFTQNGFPVKPSVSISGFPFLTQLAAKDFKTVNISASNVPAGPVTIDTVHATINGMHISSFSSNASARVDKLNATAFISFGALASAGGIAGGSGVKVTQAGPNTVKISADLGGIFNDSEEAQILTTGPQTISVKLLPSKGALGSLLSSFGSFSFSLPKGVPASLRITKLTLNDQGLTVSASATNATFSK